MVLVTVTNTLFQYYVIHIYTTITKTALAINELQNLGYTENGIGGAVSCKLNYVDNEDEVVIEIRDFDVESIYLYYTWYIYGGKLIYCNECGKLILSYSTTYLPKYCNTCSDLRDIESDRKYNLKRRK